MILRTILENRLAPIVFLIGMEWLFAIASPAELLLQAIIAAILFGAHALERRLRAS